MATEFVEHNTEMRNFDNYLKLGPSRDHSFTEEKMARHGRTDANGCCSSCGLDVIKDLEDLAIHPRALQEARPPRSERGPRGPGDARPGEPRLQDARLRDARRLFKKYGKSTPDAMRRLLSSVLCWAHLEEHEAGKKYSVSQIASGAAELNGKSTARRRHLYFREIGCGCRPKCTLLCHACHHLEDTLPRRRARQQAFHNLADRHGEWSLSQ